VTATKETGFNEGLTKPADLAAIEAMLYRVKDSHGGPEN